MSLSLSPMIRGLSVALLLASCGGDILPSSSVQVGAATQLAFTTQPSNSTAGTSFGTVVTAQDASNGTATGFAGTVNLAITGGTGKTGAHLLGTTSVTAVAGVATFSGLSIDSAGTGYTLTGAATGLSSAVSSAFNIAAGAVSTSQSTVSVSAATVASGGTVTLTLQAKDANNNNLTSGGLTVAFTASGGTSTGTIGATTDNANGTYTATFTAVTAGTATTVHATIGGTAVTSTLPTITVTPGGVSTSQSTVSVSAGTVASGGTVSLTLQAKNASGANLTTGGLTVVFTVSGGTSTGTIGATTDNANGTYTATFTAVTAGTATTVHATIGGTAVTSTLPTITVTPGAVSTSQSTVSVSAASVAVNGTAALTLQAKDANGNNLTTGGLTVVFTASGGTSTGTIGATTDNANGTYTATFTGVTAGTATTIGATINGTAVTSTLPTVTVISGSSLWPNQPAGFTALEERAFNSLGLLGASGTPDGSPDSWSYITYGAYQSIVTDASAPKSPPNVWQSLYPGPADGVVVAGTGGNGVFTRTFGTWTAGAEVGKSHILYTDTPGIGGLVGLFVVTSNDATHIYFSGNATGATNSDGWPGGAEPTKTWVYYGAPTTYTQLYVSFWVKLSSNWYRGSSGGGNKIFFFNNNGTTHSGTVIAEAFGGGPDTAGTGALFVDVATQSSPDPNNWSAHNVSSVRIVRNTWQRWEVLLIDPGAGINNCTIKVWIDGVAALNVTNAFFGDASYDHHFSGIEFTPVWGGSGNAKVPADQYLWADHIYVSGHP